jgi:hypothetical protein
MTKTSEESKPVEQVVSGIVLPMKPRPATHKSPKNIIIFSKPKTGKTSLIAQLPNWLILDLEDGSDYVDSMSVKAKTVEDIRKIGAAIKEAGNPYDGIAVDTITALEEICIPYAELLYSRTAMGKNWFKANADGTGLADDAGKKIYSSILNMPNGAGYPYLREAFSKMIDYIKTWAPRVILVGHIKDVLLEKNGTEFNALDLDLTGKIKRITSAQSDAIGYLYRKGNQNILSFKTTDEVGCGARPDHLRNAEIVISEMIDNKLVTHWDQVYID